MNLALKGAVLLGLVLVASAACGPKANTADSVGKPAPPPSAVTPSAIASAPAPSASVAVSPPAPAPASASALASASPTPPAAPAKPKRTSYFWFEDVVLEGTLVRKVLPWSSGRAVPVVVFDHSISVKAKPGSSAEGLEPVSGAKEAWLSYNGIDKAAVTALIGKTVTYRGSLEPGLNMNHLSNPWLDGSVTER